MYMTHWREGTTELGSQPGDRPFGPVVVQPDAGWRALAVVHWPHPVLASEDYVVWFICLAEYKFNHVVRAAILNTSCSQPGPGRHSGFVYD